MSDKYVVTGWGPPQESRTQKKPVKEKRLLQAIKQLFGLGARRVTIERETPK